jgi:hypothetical protein
MALVVIGVTICPSDTTGLPGTAGGGGTIGAAAAGTGVGAGGVSAIGNNVTVGADDGGAARLPLTTVPPGNAVAIGGSSGRGSTAGAWAHAADPVSRAALVSHRRIPRMVCLAAVGGRRPSGRPGPLSPSSAGAVANLSGCAGPAGRAGGAAAGTVKWDDTDLRTNCMNVVILRDPDEAQRFLLQGLWFQRAVPPIAANVRHVLEWAIEIAAGGQPLPPVGVVADLGHAAFGTDRDTRGPREPAIIPHRPPALMRTYEDHVLGKVYADWSFERASDALRRFQGRDRARGLAYVVKQLRDRAGYGGVELSPGIIRTLIDAQPDELLRRGWESITADGPMPLLIDLYETLIAAARRMAEVLGLEDVVALEQRTALADMGQYVAHRQVLQIAGHLEAGLPRHKVKPLAGRREVPTRVLDEDTYPVGGFSSISTKGTVESLLHSQLAYMERDPNERPDLFDVKYLRDELYYYSRDENQFLRRRRVFLFCLYPDLMKARFKDAELPAQRIVMVLSLLLTAVKKLSEWLSTDALKFEFLLVQDKDARPLAQEGALLEMLFRDQIENGTVEVRHLAEPVGPYAERRAERSMCHVLNVSAEGEHARTDLAISTGLMVADPRPVVRIGFDEPIELPGDEPIESWTATLERLLMVWV